MMPLPEHEYYREVLSDATKDITDVLDRDYESYRSTTWWRRVKKAGLEPDNCFYFQHKAQVRGQLTFDLEQDSLPDLAIEIDLTNKSLNRFPIDARLGVPELWCCDSGNLIIDPLQEDDYLEVTYSAIFPSFPLQNCHA